MKVELFDDGDEVAEFEFDADMKNATSFFSPFNLKRSSYDDIQIGVPFPGDGFSFDGYKQLHLLAKFSVAVLNILQVYPLLQYFVGVGSKESPCLKIIK